MEAPHGSNTSKGNGWVAALPHLNRRPLKVATAEPLTQQSLPQPWKVSSAGYRGLRERTPRAKNNPRQASTHYRSNATPDPLNGHAFQCSNQRTNMSKVTSETLLEEPVAILGLENRGISHKVMSERLPLQIAARCF